MGFSDGGIHDIVSGNVREQQVKVSCTCHCCRELSGHGGKMINTKGHKVIMTLSSCLNNLRSSEREIVFFSLNKVQL